MILHALTIRNWCNIGSLELCDLDHPLLVLYGPNRTGKSSIVSAIRACLYDYDHDSTAAPLADAVPWHTKKTPEVAVEFETGGARYRLTKRFSRRSEGDAILERAAGASGWTVLQRGKEAGREARTLLGAQKSNDGLNQLLWLSQGEVHLPPATGLCGSLQKRMQDVLGTLLTAHDWDFSQVLERACGAYFTKAMKEKPSSIVATLQRRYAECEERVQEQRRRISQADALVREYQALQAEIEQDERQHAESRREVAALEQEHAAAQQRLREQQLAEQALEAAGQEFERAERAVADYRNRRSELAVLAKTISTREPDLECAVASHETLQRELQTATGELKKVRAARERHEGGRLFLEDYRRLLEIDRDARRLEERLEQVERAEERLRELREEFAGVAAPDPERLTALRANRRKAGELRARLDAASLELRFEPAGEMKIEAVFDSAGASATDAVPGEAVTWKFRERAELRLGKCGTVRITRGRGDETLEQAARQLEGLEREYADALGQYGLSPADEDAVITLSQRQAQRESLGRQIRAQFRQVQELSPHGREELLAARERLTEQRAVVLHRRPELAEVGLSGEEWQARQREFEKGLKLLRDRQQAGEAKVERLQTEERRADADRRKLHEELQSARIKLHAGEAELERCGDELALQDALSVAQRRRDEAAQRVRETELTEQERTVAERLQSAQAALEQRQRRHNERVNYAHGVRGQLRAMDGLHEDLSAAEAQLVEISTQLEEERLNADALRLLRERFDECRNRQVQRTTGRIATQVMDWSNRLGLAEYREVEFGEGYLPSGFRRPDTERLVALADESFGTLEQMALLIRLAVGRLVANGERQVAILDDPLTHADAGKHRRMLEILQDAAAGSRAEGNGVAAPAPLQILIFTCHPERFDHLPSARQVDLRECIVRD